MKKILIFLLAACLFTACKNNKANPGPGSKDSATMIKDDYRSKDTTGNNQNSSDNYSDRKNDNKNSTDNSGGDNGSNGNTGDQGSNGNSNTGNSGGWSKSDEAEWMKACSDPLNEKMGEEKTKTYCSCMLDKLKVKYSSYAELNTNGTYNEGVEIGKICLREMGLQSDQ